MAYKVVINPKFHVSRVHLYLGIFMRDVFVEHERYSFGICKEEGDDTMTILQEKMLCSEHDSFSTNVIMTKGF